MISCSSPRVLVLDDEVTIHALGEQWPFHSIQFRFQSFLRGIRIRHEQIEDDQQVMGLVQEWAKEMDLVLLSPFLAEGLDSESSLPIITMTLGVPSDNTDVVLMARRDDAIRELGQWAAEWPGEQDVLALVDGATEQKRQEIEVFRQSFSSHSESSRLKIVNLAAINSASLPEDFSARASGAHLLVLLAGMANLDAVVASAEEGVPFVSEGIRSTGYRQNRLVGSLEVSGKDVKQAFWEGLKQGVLTTQEGEGMIVEYPVQFIPYKSMNP
ncbi:MAG: hypothetical protein MI717_12355 [Spirochaetales bacterium]|nr:hypothetical protein [Spirochaetales bacterium]